MTQCPNCKGTRVILGYVGSGHGPRHIHCHVCNGTGEVDDDFIKCRDIGIELRNKRIKLNLGLAEVARCLHVTTFVISKIEQGLIKAPATYYDSLSPRKFGK